MNDAWRAAALATAAVLAATVAGAQVPWSKVPSNPVMAPSHDFFEALAIGQPAVLPDVDGTLRLWYAARGGDGHGRILAARSMDGGLSWQRENGGLPVLDTGPEGAWDALLLDTPEVVRDESGYRLYYYGASSHDSSGAAIGLAVSGDGLHFERRGGGPVLRPGPPGSWDGAWVESPAVIPAARNGRDFMWYTGVDASGFVRIGLATSPDGVHWTKWQGNPVLDLGAPGGWEDVWVAVPGVIGWRGGFLMVYSAVGSGDLADGSPDDIGVGLAFSIDGIDWHRYPGNPVLTTSSPPYDPAVDAHGPWAPDLVLEAGGRNLLMLFESGAGLDLARAPVEPARRPGGRSGRSRLHRPPPRETGPGEYPDPGGRCPTGMAPPRRVSLNLERRRIVE